MNLITYFSGCVLATIKRSNIDHFWPMQRKISTTTSPYYIWKLLFRANAYNEECALPEAPFVSLSLDNSKPRKCKLSLAWGGPWRYLTVPHGRLISTKAWRATRGSCCRCLQSVSNHKTSCCLRGRGRNIGLGPNESSSVSELSMACSWLGVWIVTLAERDVQPITFTLC